MSLLERIPSICLDRRTLLKNWFSDSIKICTWECLGVFSSVVNILYKLSCLRKNNFIGTEQ